MTGLQNPSLTPAEELIFGRLQPSLTCLAELDDVCLEFESETGARVPLLGGPPQGHHIPFFIEDSGARVHLYFSGRTATERHLLETTVRTLLEKLEVEKREELLLDELGSNWESLEALYEISTDVLRFGDVRQALSRLIERLTSLQDGLAACLFINRNSRLEPLTASYEQPAVIEWSDLGAITTPIQESRSVVINDPAARATGDGSLPWDTATSLAAAPITSQRQTVIGLLLVWRNDQRYIFDAPFSRLLEAITHQASMLLESDRLNRTMLENDRLAKEIEIASSIQQTLLLGNAPKMASMEIASFSSASQQIDGDFLDFLQHGDAVDVMIGDVMGKGIAAALLGAATKSQFLRALANLAIRRGGLPSPVDIVRRSASRLGERLISLERFVTLCYARFDPVQRTVDFVDCGHTGILVHRKNSRETFFLRGDDLPLGIYLTDEWHQHTADLMPGDTFLLFSDGVTETRRPDGELFGDDRLMECLENWSSLGPDLLLEKIRQATDLFRDGGSQTDDFSCIALRIPVGDRNARLTCHQTAFPAELDQLGAFRDWLREYAAGLDAESLARLDAATVEAFVNCVRHGALPDGNAPVRAAVHGYESHLTIDLRHAGPPFDPMSVPPPSFDGSRDGGFGTFIILRSADEVVYSREGGENLISITIMRR